MFEAFEKLPDDPILGLTAAFQADSNPKKVDLGVGVYRDPQGKTPVFAAVKKAETLKLEQEKSKTYTGIEGDPVFNEQIQKLILGENHPSLRDGRSCAIVGPGGSGSLRVAAEVINAWKPGANVWVSNPSWPNHIPLIGTAGLTMKEYPYYDNATHSIRTGEMMDQIAKLGSNDVLLIHSCCHNPTGADLNMDHWKEITRLAQKNGFTPFVDAAYQGLGRGLNEDAEGLRYLAEAVPEIIIAYSCSKNFGLYRDRVGALQIVTKKAATTTAVMSHMKSVARRLYSVPPAHGAIVVGMILADAALKQSWATELEGMCKRINSMRKLFTDMMAAKGSKQDFSFVSSQYGMFSMLGLTVDQVQRLKKDYSVYMVNSSRVNIAGISEDNIDYLTDSVLAVL